jgi:hypothetical protein
MAKKPTKNDILERKNAFKAFLEKHALSTHDVCELMNQGSVRQTSLRAVQCWLADATTTSSRTPPEDIIEKLEEKMGGKGQRRTA